MTDRQYMMALEYVLSNGRTPQEGDRVMVPEDVQCRWEPQGAPYRLPTTTKTTVFDVLLWAARNMKADHDKRERMTWAVNNASSWMQEVERLSREAAVEVDGYSVRMIANRLHTAVIELRKAMYKVNTKGAER